MYYLGHDQLCFSYGTWVMHYLGYDQLCFRYGTRVMHYLGHDQLCFSYGTRVMHYLGMISCVSVTGHESCTTWAWSAVFQLRDTSHALPGHDQLCFSYGIRVMHYLVHDLLCFSYGTRVMHYLGHRVSSKQTKINYGSNRNKPKQDLFRTCFGLFQVCFLKPKRKNFGLFRCFEPKSKQLKQTDLFRFSEKFPNMLSFKLFEWVFCLFQYNRNSQFRYRSETTERNCFETNRKKRKMRKKRKKLKKSEKTGKP